MILLVFICSLDFWLDWLIFVYSSSTVPLCTPSSRDVPRSKIGWTGMDRTTFPFKTGLVLSHFSPVSPYFWTVFQTIQNPFKGLIMPFFTYFLLFSDCFACQTRSKKHPKAKLYHFWQRFNHFLSKPGQRHSTTLFFLSRGRFFPAK